MDIYNILILHTIGWFIYSSFIINTLYAHGLRVKVDASFVIASMLTWEITLIAGFIKVLMRGRR